MVEKRSTTRSSAVHSSGQSVSLESVPDPPGVQLHCWADGASRRPGRTVSWGLPSECVKVLVSSFQPGGEAVSVGSFQPGG